ncbi:uncharacterized protein [Spinacia oleracea]|uniref:Uncharacterized protein isoform X3 n=1 Tax=Spinacia oleracea TaxID=3562 RepID=A0ABM3R9Z2_SPIOL|nr:uncharacterized protein LOC110805703 isoform X3 [Spinacia oleracea]
MTKNKPNKKISKISPSNLLEAHLLTRFYFCCCFPLTNRTSSLLLHLLLHFSALLCSLFPLLDLAILSTPPAKTSTRRTTTTHLLTAKYNLHPLEFVSSAKHEVSHEGETGKVSRANFRDREGRTVLIMRHGKQNTTSGEGNVRHLVYLLENAILNLPEGQEQMVWLIDYTGFSMSTSLSVRTSRDIINILQKRLGLAVLYNPPRIFQEFWRMCNEIGHNIMS